GFLRAHCFAAAPHVRPVIAVTDRAIKPAEMVAVCRDRCTASFDQSHEKNRFCLHPKSSRRSLMPAMPPFRIHLPRPRRLDRALLPNPSRPHRRLVLLLPSASPLSTPHLLPLPLLRPRDLPMSELPMPEPARRPSCGRRRQRLHRTSSDLVRQA